MNIKRLVAFAPAVFVLIGTVSTLQAQVQIERKELGVAQLGPTEISKVDAREITFKPMQKTGLHLHPGPVVGYIASGKILFEVEGRKS